MENNKYHRDLDSLPFLDWDIFDDRQFLKGFDGAVMRGGDHMISWGCPNTCSYCINHVLRDMYGSAGIRRYSVDRFVEEIHYLVDRYNLNFFKFHDEDFALKPLEYFADLANKYPKIPFTCMVNAHSLNEYTVELMSHMGCVSATVGIETGDPFMRELLRRKESREDIIRGVRLLKDAGIRTSSFNMIGLPFESEHTIKETIKLNAEAGVDHPNVGIFFPLENTDLKKIAIEAGFYDGLGVWDRTKPALKFKDLTPERIVWYRDNFARLCHEY
jgi:radical SAM superfamily enzyme YgiQ (UPF0313 family)